MSLDLDSKKPGEVINVTFSLANLGASISGTPVVSLSWYSGTVESPITLISGVVNVSGTDVVVPISGGIAGADYKVRLTVDLADGQHLFEDAVIPVRE